MNRISTWISYVWICCFAASFPAKAMAEIALMDLTNTPIAEQKSVILDGPWELYWDELIPDPEPKRAPDALMFGGKGWRSLELSGQRLPAVGKATFRLRIKGISPAERTYTLKIPAMESAMNFQLFDARTGSLIGAVSAGVLADPSSSFPSKRDQHLSFVAKPGHEYILVLQLVNTMDSRGGFMDMVVLWKDDLVIRQQDQDGLLNALCLGVCLASGISTFLMWVRRRSDIASFYLFLVCMAGVGRIVSTNQSILKFVDDLHYPTLKAWEYASMAMSMFFAQFIHYAFPQVPIKRWLIHAYFGLTLGFIFISLVLEPVQFTALLSYYQLAVLGGILLVLYMIGGALYLRLPGALLATTGCLVIIAAVLFDIILVNRLKLFSFFASSIGVAIYMTLQAQLVAARAAMTYKLAEHLAKENEKAQKALRIETETRFGLATAVAHRLNNPLNYIQMGLNDIRSHIELLKDQIATLLAPSPDEDAEMRSVRQNFDQIFEDLSTPFSHAQKGLQKATASIQEIRTLSGIDGLSVNELQMGYVIQEVSLRMTEQVDGTSYRRLSFHCTDTEALLRTNLYLLKNVIEVYIGHSLQLSEGSLQVKAEAERDPPLWNIRLTGKLIEDADDWKILEERLSYVLRPIGAKLWIRSEGDDRVLTIAEPPYTKPESLDGLPVAKAS